MSAFINLSGCKFGRLKVLKLDTENKNRQTYWICECECGSNHSVRASHLKSGGVKSCGCFQKDKIKTHGESNTKLYRVWRSMRNRCENSNDAAYSKYGGRGINVSNEWKDFSIFRKWSKYNGYKEGLTLDRINNDGDYSPDNCRWTDWVTQERNRGNVKLHKIHGELMTVPEMAEKYGVNYKTIWNRIIRGWSGDDLVKPIKKGRWTTNG